VVAQHVPQHTTGHMPRQHMQRCLSRSQHICLSLVNTCLTAPPCIVNTYWASAVSTRKPCQWHIQASVHSMHRIMVYQTHDVLSGLVLATRAKPTHVAKAPCGTNLLPLLDRCGPCVAGWMEGGKYPHISISSCLLVSHVQQFGRMHVQHLSEQTQWVRSAKVCVQQFQTG
jgi:hypothetical protein